MEATNQFPPLLRYSLHASDRLHEHFVGDTCFWHPYGAEQMHPVSQHSLFEGASFVGTQNARLCVEVESRHTSKDTYELLTTGFSGDTVHLRQSH